MFYNLIQLDGFNPLIINMKTYQLTKNKNKEVQPLVASRDYEKLIHQLNSPYTPGGIIKFIERNDIELLVHVKEFLEKIISFLTFRTVQPLEKATGRIGGYIIWIGESYLSVYRKIRTFTI